MALPAGWDSADIGTVGASGSSNESGGTYTIIGAGFDVYGQADGLQLAWQPAKDNAVIVARVASLTGDKTIAGITLRQTLRSDSKHVTLLATQFGGLELRSRIGTTATVTGGGGYTAINNRVTGQVVPIYLRITRSGATVQAAYSSDGISYTDIGSPIRINFTDKLYVGLLTCGRGSSTGTATFTNVSLTTNTPGSWYYVSPTATAGTGTWADPYSLFQVAATATPPSITGPATIWVLAGTYTGHFNLTLAGSSGNLISLRGYPGERVVIDHNRSWTLAAAMGTNPTTDRTATFVSDTDLAVADVIVIGTEAILLDRNGGAAANSFNLCTRAWDGTTIQAHSSGDVGRVKSAAALLLSGSFTEARDLEITDSYLADRIIDTSNSNPPTGRRYDGLIIAAASCQAVNIYSHDSGEAFFSGSAYNGIVVESLIGLSNGWLAPDRGHGHGLYVQASSATGKDVRLSVLSNNFGTYNLHAYSASAPINGINISKCVFYGKVLPTSADIIAKAGFLAQPISNCSFNDSIIYGGNGLQCQGDADTNNGMSVLRNRIYASNPFQADGFTGTPGCTVTSNQFISVQDAQSGLVNGAYWKTSGGTSAAFAFTLNAYYKGLFDVFRYGPYGGTHVTATFAGWQAFGYDTAGTFTSPDGSKPAANESFLWPGTLDTNRAALSILNWLDSATINVDPSAFLTSGDVYEIRFSANPTADPVLSGTYSSGNLSIPMSRRASAIPLGAINLIADSVAGTYLELANFFIVKK